MTPKQIDLVQSSFRLLVPIAEKVAAIFYLRLFQFDPSLRALFRTDTNEPGIKLIAAIGAIVGNLRNLDRVVPGLEAMGVRHVASGVKDDHYISVGAALMDTLEVCLGDAFTEDVREAWIVAYGVLAIRMKNAAARSVAA